MGEPGQTAHYPDLSQTQGWENPPPYQPVTAQPGYGPGAAPAPPPDSGYGPGATAVPSPNAGGFVQPTAEIRFRDRPVQLTCPNCHQDVTTRLRHESGLFTFAICGGICLVFWCGCCLVPFCMNSLKDVEHSCPNCNTILGTYKRLNL